MTSKSWRSHCECQRLCDLVAVQPAVDPARLLCPPDRFVGEIFRCWGNLGELSEFLPIDHLQDGMGGEEIASSIIQLAIQARRISKVSLGVTAVPSPVRQQCQGLVIEVI